MPAGPVGTFGARAIAAVNGQRAKLGLPAFTSFSIRDLASKSWLPPDDWARAWADVHKVAGNAATKMPLIPLTYTDEKERAEAASRTVLATVDVTADLAPIEMPDVPIQQEITLRDPAQDGPGAAKDDPLHPVWQRGFDLGVSDPLAGFLVPPKEALLLPPWESAAFNNGLQAGRMAAARLQNLAPAAEACSKGGAAAPEGAEAVPGSRVVRYNFKSEPVLKQVLTAGPAGTLEVEIRVNGSVAITLPAGPSMMAFDADSQTWRVDALNALGPLRSGIRLSGLGGEAPAVGAVANNGLTFTRQETRFTPPNTVSYAWQVAVNYTGTVGATKADVAGTLGLVASLTYTPGQPALAVPAQPVPDAAPAVPRDLGSFFETYGPVFAAAAAVVVVAALVVATDGLILIPAAAAL